MIDLIKAEKEFKDYLKDYDVNDGSINLKIVHTYEVMKLSMYLAKELKLSEEDIKLAGLIGLLHDIGRFEQVSVTATFADNQKFDHGDYGVKVLFEDKLIRKFIDDSSYDNIIKKAVLNHNKYRIEDGLDERELLHCKIIRDADKVDNFRVKETESFENNYPGIDFSGMKDDDLSDTVYEQFLSHVLINIHDRRTKLDYWLCIIAFVFDLYFDVSYKYVKDKNYINILIDKFKCTNPETIKKMEIMRKDALEYIESKI